MGPTASPIAAKYLRLHLCQEVGSIRFANLLRELGDIDAVLSASHSALTRVTQIGDKVASNILRDRGEEHAVAEIARAEAAGARILCLADDDYPVALRNIPDPPACLFVRGEVRREDAVALAVVGSRHCSRYGAEQAERLAALAAGAGLTIVSGMAYGIDTYAHRGALAAGGRTIAVMGCGLNHVYPPESKELARQIVANGAILSELPMDVGPDSKNFPPRNRIIAGLSLGVVVVEAARRSGALITARLATEYNREVFAVPGSISSISSQGCNDLIKNGGAKLVSGLPDILEELGDVGRALGAELPQSQSTPFAPESLAVALNDEERTILESLRREAGTIDAVCESSGLGPARVASVLTSLQLKGQVRRVGSGFFEVAGR